MPGLTVCRSYPYPVDADPIDVAGDIKKLADKVDTDTCALFDTTSKVGKWVGGVTPGGTVPVGQQRTVAQMTFPFAAIWLVHYTTLITSTTSAPPKGALRFFINSTFEMDFIIPVGNDIQLSCQVTFPCNVAAGGTCGVNLINSGPSDVNTWADPVYHRLGAHAMLA